MLSVVSRLAALVVLAVLAACTKPVVYAPDDIVQAARHVHGGPAEIRLFNVVSNDSGQGAHAALLINSTERVLFDPAGSWQHPEVPEQHDLHFGMTDMMVYLYTHYHARRTHHVRIQTLQVPPEVAARILHLARQAGPVADGHCAYAIAKILREIPGFEGISLSYYPNRLSDDFARLPGVTEERIDSDREPTPKRQYTALAVR